jgi:hypothetical protein
VYGPRDVRDDLTMNDFLRKYLGMTGTKFGCGAAQCLPKPRRSSATNNHGSTARVERADDSVEVLNRAPNRPWRRRTKWRLSFDTG